MGGAFDPQMPAAARGRQRAASDGDVKRGPVEEESGAEETEADKEQRPSSPSSIGRASSSDSEPELPRPLLLAMRLYHAILRQSPSDGVAVVADRYFRQSAVARFVQHLSLPTRLDEWAERRPAPPREEPQRRRPRLTRSQAQLIIPRSLSEYLECCRGARSHSEGLLLAFTEPEGALENCRSIVPRALSEGLLGGRLARGRRREAPEEDAPPKPPPRVPAEKLEVGARLEGRIVRTCKLGVFIDVGATRCGLLPRKSCRHLPRWMVQKGESLSSLIVLHVDRKKRQFTMTLQGVGEDGDEIEEVAYAEILHRIASWAGVEVPEGFDLKDGTKQPAKLEGEASKSKLAEPAATNGRAAADAAAVAVDDGEAVAEGSPSRRRRQRNRGSQKGSGKGQR